MNKLSSHCFPLTTIEKKPDFLCITHTQEPENDHLLAAMKTQKRKYTETDREEAEGSGVSTELSLHCSSKIMKKQPRTRSEISSTDDDKKSISTPSTELTLFDESWISDSVFQHNSSDINGKRKERDVFKKSFLEKLNLAHNIAKMRVYGGQEERKGVSTELKLFDPWNIKKKLTGSDLGNLTRLLVPTDLVKNCVLCFMNTELVEKIEKEGAKFVIWDCDTQTEHHFGFQAMASFQGLCVY